MTSRLPSQFIDRIKRIYKDQITLPNFNQPAFACFRINILKTDSSILDKLKNHFTLHVPTFIDNAFYIPINERNTLIRSDEYESGQIYSQNLSSQLPPIILNPKPTDHILDLTAAPGSKTSQLAALTNNEAKIAACEKSKNRFHKLCGNLKKLGVTNVKPFLKDGIKVGRQCPEQFDKILLDAPCSSEARFIIDDPASYEFWSLKKITDMSRVQKQLLFSAWSALKPGGALVYSTCSFSPEENEAVIDRLIQKHGDVLDILPIEINIDNKQAGISQWKNKTFDPRVKNALRVLPNDFMSGFFICLLKKLVK